MYYTTPLRLNSYGSLCYSTDKMHPYTFRRNPVTNKMLGCIASIIIPTTLVCVLFGPAIPTSSIYLVVFILYIQ